MGESHYGRFKTFWEERLAPVEDQKIAEWRDQLASAQPLDTLQRLSRLRYPFETTDVVAIGMHGAGSANTHPAGIYTGLGVRNIAWAIGHEGTHLLVDRYAGANWFARPRAAEAIRLVASRGGQQYDIEEALCLLMQARLSEAGGLTPSEYRVSARLSEPSAKRDILVALEDGWDSYRQTTRGDLVDFMLERAIYAMTKAAQQ